MQFTLKVPKKNSAFILEVLKHFKYVEVVPSVKETRAKPPSIARSVRKPKPKKEPEISDEQKRKNTEQLFEEIRCAVEQINLHKAGKIKLRLARDVLAEL
jgi:hypothetical protein